MDRSQFALIDSRRHPKFPFVRWQEDDVSFSMLKLYWAEVVRLVLGDEMASYAPLFETERDGNPILTLTNPVARRGLRLIVLENEDDAPHPDKGGADARHSLYPFLNTSCLPDGVTSVDELVMLVKLDDRYISSFEHLVQLHCCDYVSAEQMEEAIVTYEAKVVLGDLTVELPKDGDGNGAVG
jgi:hypothetical protein